MATSEQLDLRKRWVEALRSGKYKQTKKGTLKSRNGAFCCLGVLCEVAGLKVQFEDGDNYYHTEDQESDCVNLPSSLAEKIGLYTVGGQYNRFRIESDDKRVHSQDSLIALNDSTNMKFGDIADFIESNPPGLFKD